MLRIKDQRKKNLRPGFEPGLRNLESTALITRLSCHTELGALNILTRPPSEMSRSDL